MDETDDFAADLWGEDDIDEALLIEASQQVEAETIDVSKTNTSNYFGLYSIPYMKKYTRSLINGISLKLGSRKDRYPPK